MTVEAASLAELNQQMTGCTRCGLAKGRTLVVPGEGPADAELVFIGEAPGFNEDRQGRPFVGQAGGLLEEMIRSIGLTRRDVYICNVVKCRPPTNRDPQPDEIEACREWLDGQLSFLKPLVVCTLGRFSMARYFTGTISRIHGQPRKIDDIWYFPLYHPAAALHQQSIRPFLFEDMAKVPALLDQARLERAARAAVQPKAPEPEPKQLSLF